MSDSPFTRTLSTGITIAAPIGKVWLTLIDFASYAKWNTLLSNVETSLRPSDPFNFSITLDGKVLHRQSTLIAATPNVELRWAGPRDARMKSLFNGDHFLRLFELERGTTYLDHGEHFGGLLLPVLWPVLGPKLKRHYQAMNLTLKNYLERQVP